MITKSVSEELTKYRQVLTENYAGTTDKEGFSYCKKCESYHDPKDRKTCAENCKENSGLSEAWGTEMHTAKKDKGMFKGKGKEEIGSALSKNKKTAENDRAKGKKEPEGLKKKIKQEEFALRAKNNFGKVSESVNLKEGVRIGFEQLLKDMHHDVDAFIEGGEMSQGLFDALYEYYFDEMPYGVAKARSGDPYQWVSDRFNRDLEHEGLFVGGAAPAPAPETNVMGSTLGEGKTMRKCNGKGCDKKCTDGKNYCSKKCQGNSIDLKKEVPINKKLKESSYAPGPFSKAGFVAESNKSKCRYCKKTCTDGEKFCNVKCQKAYDKSE